MEKTLEKPGGQRASIWSTGLAMFSMFFGAGNIVFPLALGQFTQDKNFFGVSGLIITAVIVPLLGLLAMLLYNGDYIAFFKRIGTVPGFLVALLILGLIGPFGGIPRCITISYSTLSAFGFESFPLSIFSLISIVVIFLFTYRPNKILTLLGYLLTPLLLLSLALIVGIGFFQMPGLASSSHTSWEAFSQGILDGYNTMDLLAAFFFSSVVLLCLRRGHVAKDVPLRENRRLLWIAFAGSLIAAVLLAAVYLAFSFLAAGYSSYLIETPNHQLLGALAYKILGPYAGMIASAAVLFACLTTEIALTVVFAEFLHETIFKEKVSYTFSLGLTLGIAFLISTLHFEGISAFLAPLLQIFYPALIVLCVLNVMHKIYGFQPVKSIFYGTAALTGLLQFLI